LRLYEGANARHLLVLRYDGSSYEIRAELQRDDATWAVTSYYDITNAAHYVEVDVQRASSAIAGDGTTRLWIDGTLKETVASIDLYDLAQPTGRTAARGVSTRARRHVFSDEFVLRETIPRSARIETTLAVAPAAISTVTAGWTRP